MTESVAALCEGALAQNGVKHVTAETEPEGFASQRVMLRCGFREYCRNGTIKWRLWPSHSFPIP